MPTLSEQVGDELTVRQVRLLRVANAESSALVNSLAKLDRQVLEELSRDIVNAGPRGIEKVLRKLTASNNAAHRAVASDLADRMFDVAKVQAQALGNLLGGSVPADSLLRRGVEKRIAGRTVGTWVKGMRDTRRAEMRSLLKVGPGTKRLRAASAIMRRGRARVEEVSKTLLIGGSAQGTAAAFKVNADGVQAVIWSSVLDGGTTLEYCVPRAGLMYTVDGEPIDHGLPWGAGPGAIHFKCRAEAVPWLRGDPVPRIPSYNDFLLRQKASIQDEILGPTRGALLRRGGLDVRNFVDHRGKFLLLDDLKSLDAIAFENAGIEGTILRRSPKQLARAARIVEREQGALFAPTPAGASKAIRELDRQIAQLKADGISSKDPRFRAVSRKRNRLLKEEFGQRKVVPKPPVPKPPVPRSRPAAKTKPKKISELTTTTDIAQEIRVLEQEFEQLDVLKPGGIARSRAIQRRLDQLEKRMGVVHRREVAILERTGKPALGATKQSSTVFDRGSVQASNIRKKFMAQLEKGDRTFSLADVRGKKVGKVDMDRLKTLDRKLAEFRARGMSSTRERHLFRKSQSEFDTIIDRVLFETGSSLRATSAANTAGADRARTMLAKLIPHRGSKWEMELSRIGKSQTIETRHVKKSKRIQSFFERMWGGEPITARVLVEDKLKRAHYVARTGTSYVGPWDASRVWVHEIGHHLEHSFSWVNESAIAFLKRRAGTERLRRIPGYGRHEIAFFDKFKQKYSGKVYNAREGNSSSAVLLNGRSEIVSMGLDQMFTNPLAFARSDPDYFDFILELLIRSGTIQ